MRLAVAPFIQSRVGEAKVGGEVDDAFGQAGEVFDAPLGLAMRKSQKEHVARGQLRRAGEAQRLASTSRCGPQVGMHAVHVVAGVGLGGHLSDFDVRVLHEQPQQLAAAVSGCADDGNSRYLTHSWLLASVNSDG